LASGDPLGDPEAWPGAIHTFIDLAAAHAWVPAVLGCSEAGGIAYRRAGLQVLEFGDEAVVSTAAFTLEGRAMRGVRQAVARIERAGYTARVDRVGDLSVEERRLLAARAAAWRGSDTERGFSMALGRFAAPCDPDCVVARAFQGGEMRGFLYFAPWGDDGLSLDAMRRDRNADNGVNEFLIALLLRAAPGLGIARVSLNFAFFRHALAQGERLGAGPVLRLWRGVLMSASRWFQIESIYRFNAKFHPEWMPRYFCYPNTRDLPRISLAALEAEAFLTWPRLGRSQPRGSADGPADGPADDATTSSSSPLSSRPAVTISNDH
jgi:lysyl-tRNA synthetase class 2